MSGKIKAASKKELQKEDKSIIIKEKRASDGRYTWSQQTLEEIKNNDLSGIRFTKEPIYNPRIRCNGKTTIAVNKYNDVLYIEKIEIGKQDKSSLEFLEDTIIHEELEARIAMKSNLSSKYKHLYTADELKRHDYINKVINRFFKTKGWWHDG
ncbi:MAG: hypothetical protein IKW59_01805 [Clostridia bacterium]|nr:hypothetical protein [Clostridia bacterium]